MNVIFYTIYYYITVVCSPLSPGEVLPVLHHRPATTAATLLAPNKIKRNKTTASDEPDTLTKKDKKKKVKKPSKKTGSASKKSVVADVNLLTNSSHEELAVTESVARNGVDAYHLNGVKEVSVAFTLPTILYIKKV